MAVTFPIRSSWRSTLMRIGGMVAILSTLCVHPGTGSTVYAADPVEVAANHSMATPGKDGALTITAPNTIVNTYTALAANAASGNTSISVTNAAALGATPGDLLLIIQLQGATINTADTPTYGNVTSYNNSGNYEFVTIFSVAGNTLNLPPCGGALQHNYTASGHVQVVRVPQYTTLTINAGASITAPAWNGTTGGVAAVHVQNTTTVNGAIDVTGLGFRGGVRENNTTPPVANKPGYIYNDSFSGAEKGESIAGFQADYDALGGRYGRGAPANGGGGGNAHNAGGGGGANGDSGLIWNGQGNPDNSVAGWTTAWNLDPTLNSGTTSSGGGRGGYTFSFSNDALTVPPGNAAWTGDYRQERGGLGGHPLTSNPLNRLFFGGGGGAGDGNNNASAYGGSGGGLVFVISNVVTGTGTVQANGANGPNTIPNHNDAPGGGGGGGTVIVSATTLSGIAINANGGKGGNQLITNNEAEGLGGGGGGGLIATSGGAVVISVNGGLNGTTTSAAVTEFVPNGATRGGVGNTSNVVPTLTNSPCLGVAKTVTDITGSNPFFITLSIVVVNIGTEPLNNVQVTDDLSATFGATPFVVTVPPSVVFTSGSGTLTGNAGFDGSTNINLLTSGTLSVGATAVITFTVQVTGTGVFNNTANGSGTGAVSSGNTTDPSQNGTNPDPDSDGNPGNNNVPTPIVLPPLLPPTVAKAFVPGTIAPGGTSLLTITLSNPNPVALTGATFNDNLPTGLTTIPGTAGTTCGGTATQTTTSVSLTGGTIPATGNCTVTITVTASGGGTYDNIIPAGGLITTNGGSNTTPATSSLTVTLAPPLVAKSFTPASIPVGGTSTLTILLTNPNAVALTGAAFTDNLPGGVTTLPTTAATTCGGTPGQTATSVSLTGGTIPPNGSCVVTVSVTSTTPGPAVTNTIPAGGVTTTNSGPNTTPATATLSVTVAVPTIVKSFGAASFLLNGTTSLSFLLTNSNNIALSNLAFTDLLPAGLTAPSGGTAMCGGTLTITGGNTLTFSGGALAANTTCTITVTVTGVASGAQNNTTGPISSTETGTGNPSNTATTTVLVPTAVNLLYFHAESLQGWQIRLTWATAMELDNFGFKLYRAPVNDAGRAAFIHFEPSLVKGSRAGASYSYTDAVPADGMWWYWLADVDTSGVEMLHPLSTSASTKSNGSFVFYLPLIRR